MLNVITKLALDNIPSIRIRNHKELADFTLENGIKCNVVCTDKARGNIVWKDGDNDNKFIRDPGAKQLASKHLTASQDVLNEMHVEYVKLGRQEQELNGDTKGYIDDATYCKNAAQRFPSTVKDYGSTFGKRCPTTVTTSTTNTYAPLLTNTPTTTATLAPTATLESPSTTLNEQATVEPTPSERMGHLKYNLAVKLLHNHYYLKYAVPYVLGCWVRHKVYNVVECNKNEVLMRMVVDRNDETIELVVPFKMREIVDVVKEQCDKHIKNSQDSWMRGMNVECAQLFHPHTTYDSVYKQMYTTKEWVHSEHDHTRKFVMMTQEFVSGFRNPEMPEIMKHADENAKKVLAMELEEAKEACGMNDDDEEQGDDRDDRDDRWDE